MARRLVTTVVITSFARFQKQHVANYRNSQTSESFVDKHNNMQRQKLYSRKTTENPELSLFTMRSFLYMQCSNARFSDKWSVGTCPCVRSRTSLSKSFQVFLVAARRINNCSSIQLQVRISHFIRKLWASSFVIFIGKVHVFMSHNAAGFLWTRNLYLFLNSD